jgi:hypothetical protein
MLAEKESEARIQNSGERPIKSFSPDYWLLTPGSSIVAGREVAAGGAGVW